MDQSLQPSSLLAEPQEFQFQRLSAAWSPDTNIIFDWLPATLWPKWIRAMLFSKPVIAASLENSAKRQAARFDSNSNQRVRACRVIQGGGSYHEGYFTLLFEKPHEHHQQDRQDPEFREVTGKACEQCHLAGHHQPEKDFCAQRPPSLQTATKAPAPLFQLFSDGYQAQ